MSAFDYSTTKFYSDYTHPIQIFANGNRGPATIEQAGVPFMGAAPLQRGISGSRGQNPPWGSMGAQPPADLYKGPIYGKATAPYNMRGDPIAQNYKYERGMASAPMPDNFVGPVPAIAGGMRFRRF